MKKNSMLNDGNTIANGMVEPAIVIDEEYDEMLQLDDALYLTIKDFDLKEKCKQLVKMYGEMLLTRDVEEFDEITSQFEDFEDYVYRYTEHNNAVKMSDKIYEYTQGVTSSQAVILNAVAKHLAYYNEHIEEFADVYNYCNDFFETCNKKFIEMRKNNPHNHHVMMFCAKFPIMNGYKFDPQGKKVLLARKFAKKLADKYFELEDLSDAPKTKRRKVSRTDIK